MRQKCWSSMPLPTWISECHSVKSKRDKLLPFLETAAFGAMFAALLRASIFTVTSACFPQHVPMTLKLCEWHPFHNIWNILGNFKLLSKLGDPCMESLLQRPSRQLQWAVEPAEQWATLGTSTLALLSATGLPGTAWGVVAPGSRLWFLLACTLHMNCSQRR